VGEGPDGETDQGSDESQATEEEEERFRFFGVFFEVLFDRFRHEVGSV